MPPAGASGAEPRVARSPRRVSLREIFLTFLLIGATSFGGGLVAYLRTSVVRSKHWMTDDEFLAALEIAQALPGLNSTNMSVLVGDLLRGWRGAVVAFLGMTLPGTAMVLGLSAVYVELNDNPLVNGVLAGVGAVSVGLLAGVTLQVGQRQLGRAKDLLVVVATALLIEVVHAPFLLVLLTMTPLAVWMYRPRASA